MKILYSVQATGNGHISRAMELLPYLQHYGTVDIFLSGANSTLNLAAPIKYRSKGLSLFYTCTGSIDRWKLFKNLEPYRIFKEVRDLPVERYDLILNDFECITAMACAYRKIPSVNFGHQASFLSEKVPRPDKRSTIGEWVLKNYAKANKYVGLHFQRYDDFIINPVIKDKIVNADPTNKGHITVYLPSYCDRQLTALFNPFNDFRFEIFSREIKSITTNKHLTFIPVSKEAFDESLISCYGIITGAGFETPAEALYLKKKMIAIPIQGQYEQCCNAAALKKLGVTTLDKIDDDFNNTFFNWISNENVPFVPYPYSTEEIIDFVMCKCANRFEGYTPSFDSILLN